MDKHYVAQNYKRTQDRKVDEFIGLCKGILADNEINEAERDILIKWLNENKVNDAQIKKIYKALIGDVSLPFLKNILGEYIGYNMQQFDIMNASTSLPVEKGLLSIEFEGKSFCLTGKFTSAIGNRKVLENMIEERNGIIKPRVVLDLDYLVIGELSNPDWIHSNYGRKIEQALKYKEKYQIDLKIISEQQLLKYL